MFQAELPPGDHVADPEQEREEQSIPPDDHRAQLQQFRADAPINIGHGAKIDRTAEISSGTNAMAGTEVRPSLSTLEQLNQRGGLQQDGTRGIRGVPERETFEPKPVLRLELAQQ